MNEIERVIRYIKSCMEADIDVTITIDKTRSHLILNALQTYAALKSEGEQNEVD